MKVWCCILVGVVIAGIWVSGKALADEKEEPPFPEITIATFQFSIGEPVTIAGGDFNNDECDDLFLVVETNRPNMIAGPKGFTFLPNPDYEVRFFILPHAKENFGEPLLVDAISAPDQIIGTHKPLVIDLDKDGKLDIVVLLFIATLSSDAWFEAFTTRLLIFWGQGDYSFIRAEVPLNLAYLPIDTSYNHVAVGDFNSDGLPDLAFLDSRYVRLRIFYNLGKRDFSAPEFVTVQLDKDECIPVPATIRAQNGIIFVAGPCYYSENEFDFFLRAIKRSKQGGWECSPLFLRNFKVEDFGDAVWDIEVADVNADGELDIFFLGPSELADPSIPRISPNFVGLYLVKGKDYESIARPDFIAWLEKGTFLSVETGVNGEIVIIVLPEMGIRYKHLLVVSSSGRMTSSRTLGGRGHLVDGVLINQFTTRELVLVASLDFESEVTLINVLRGW